MLHAHIIGNIKGNIEYFVEMNDGDELLGDLRQPGFHKDTWSVPIYVKLINLCWYWPGVNES